MKTWIGFSLVLGLVLAAPYVEPGTASAQVVIQGQVTAYPAQPYGTPSYGYAQPQPAPAYGAAPSPYVSGGMGAAPQPVRYIHRSESIPGLLIPGILGVALGWLGGAILATSIDQNCRGAGCPNTDWTAWQWLPIVGPWLSLGLSNGRDYAPMSYVTGALQDVGLILLILGVVIRDEWDEPVYAFGSSPTAPRLYLAGSPTMTGASMSATLTF